MSKLQIQRTQQGEVDALQFKFNFFGNGFRIWVYHVDGLLLETGPQRFRKEVKQFAEEMQPQFIALTHFHEDHSGNAGLLSGQGRIPIWMGKRTAEILSNPPRIPFYRRRIWGSIDPVPGEVRDVIETDRFRFRAVPTPGHAEDHIAWVEEEQGWAFTGDLFLGTRLNYGLREESLAEMSNSIRRLLTFPIRRVFCSHAGIVPEGVKSLEKKLDFLDWLREETLGLHRQGARPKEIASRLLKKQPGVVWFSAGELSPVHLIRRILQEEGV
ncbi:glyoxylase-like metal-dependent hydrolase (beta-lactamase superfamily II) [Kroppenstedtia sanguinis]|uniref:MBL fold metallo-hydrolase n=1 Tax=Kroppenstedtia sanguinis TaxID=1380684 RepID=UPI003D21B0C2